MAVQIQFRRGTASEWATVDPVLAVAEMGIETDTDLFKIGNGVDTWTELDYGGLRGFAGSTGYAGSIGNMSVDNVLYVSESGNDSNSGTALNLSKRTIRAALAVATRGTTIFVKSGDYIENNPKFQSLAGSIATKVNLFNSLIDKQLDSGIELFDLIKSVLYTWFTISDGVARPANIPNEL
jgi:hypothetical protein